VVGAWRGRCGPWGETVQGGGGCIAHGIVGSVEGRMLRVGEVRWRFGGEEVGVCGLGARDADIGEDESMSWPLNKSTEIFRKGSAWTKLGNSIARKFIYICHHNLLRQAGCVPQEHLRLGRPIKETLYSRRSRIQYCLAARCMYSPNKTSFENILTESMTAK